MVRMQRIATRLASRPRLISSCSRVTGFVAILLSSFGSSAQNNGAAAGKTQYYHGTIGSTHEVQMTLFTHGKQLTGSYQYASQRKPIELRGRILPSGDYEIDELNAHGQATATFTVNDLLGGGLNGTWLSGKKRLPVVLGEIQLAQLEQLYRMWSGSRKITNIVVGPFSACAMTGVGTLCWGTVSGSPSLATLGPGRVAYVALPQLSIPADITALALGDPTSCYVERGAVYCWQPNRGVLPLQTPTLIPGFERNVTDVGIAGEYACAIVARALKCWPGAALDEKTNLTTVDSGVTRLSSGMPNCALTAKVLCWTLHYAAKTQKYEIGVHPIDGVSDQVTALAAFDGLGSNTRFACAVEAGSLKCWGDDTSNILLGRRGKLGFRDVPPGVMPSLETGIIDVSVQSDNACAIRDGSVLCWGSNWYGQSGNGTTGFTAGTGEVPLPARAVKVAVGGTYACALTADNHVWCWGDNEFGQTGNTSKDTCELPNGQMPDTIPTPCNKRPVQVRGTP